jgi:two-component system response regulator WspF
VHVAATSDHLTLARDGSFTYTTQPVDYPYRPSVNALFYGLLSHWTPGLAVLMTGIGSDGAQGLLALRKAGWHTMTQDKLSSVVFGMPQAAAELGAADRILPLGEIGPYLIERVRRMHRPAS